MMARRSRRLGVVAALAAAAAIIGAGAAIAPASLAAEVTLEAASECAPKKKRSKARKSKSRAGAKSRARSTAQPSVARELAPARITPRPRPELAGAFVPARMDEKNPNSQPDYPTESRALGEQGRVVLWLEILADGSVGRALIATSSLSPRLDQAALAAAKHWRYIPATRGGVPVTSGANVFVDFKLSN